MSKHKQIIRLEDEIESLISKAEDTRKIITNVHYLTLDNMDPMPLLAKKYDFILPKLDVSKHYTSDSERDDPSEYHAVYMGIATELTSTLKDMNRRGIHTLCVVDDHIDLAVRDAYPDPNRFLSEYDDFRSWQLDGSEPETGIFWIRNFPELGNVLSHLEDLQKIQKAYNRSIKQGDMILALKILSIYKMIRNL